VQGGYGALFAVMVQVLLSITRVAVQIWWEPGNCHGVTKKIKEKKSVRGDKSLSVFVRLAYTSPAKTVTSNLPLLSVLAGVLF
jgi:hypothetical protein